MHMSIENAPTPEQPPHKNIENAAPSQERTSTAARIEAERAARIEAMKPRLLAQDTAEKAQKEAATRKRAESLAVESTPELTPMQQPETPHPEPQKKKGFFRKLLGL